MITANTDINVIRVATLITEELAQTDPHFVCEKNVCITSLITSCGG